MKKNLVIIAVIFSLLMLLSCKKEKAFEIEVNSSRDNIYKAELSNAVYIVDENTFEEKNINTGGNDKMIIIYFSRTGNTKKIVDYIEEATKADTFEIIPANDYPREYRATTDLAKKELREDIRPAIKSKINNLGSYNTVFLCYPIWWGTIPQVVKVFLLENNFSNKTIIPFTTHGGSGISSSVNDIKKYASGAKVLDGFAIRSSDVALSKKIVRDRLSSLSLLKN